MQITECMELENLLDSIGGLESLCSLWLQGNGITLLPESISKLTKLINLDVSFNKLRGLPATICDLVQLQELDVSHKKDLRGYIPGEFDKLTSLDFSKTGTSSLPVGIVNLSRLKTLSLEGCDMIQELPDLPESLTELKISSWLPRPVSNFLSLSNLVNLSLSSDRGYAVDPLVCDVSTMSWIQHPQKLEYLTVLLPMACIVCSGLDKLSRLKNLSLYWEDPWRLPPNLNFNACSGSSLTNMEFSGIHWRWNLTSLEIKE